MIHLNQVGYKTDLPKKAIITGNGEHCFVLPADYGSIDDHIPFEPILSPACFDIDSGDTVRQVDFSEITEPGEYFLFSDGLKKTFYIKEKPYHELLTALVKSMYYLRCGCALEEKHAGVYKHGVCHTGKAKLIHDESVVLDVTGGWHDAGDYGRYIVPAAVTLGHMFYSYEMFPHVYNDEMNIPESSNGVPDILNECRYELEWMLKMQRSDGGVYHKVATRYFAPFVMPEDDKEELLLFRVSHTATAGFSASLALAYRIYKNFDIDFANKILTASLKAWDWLEANPLFEPFENPPDVRSGPYGDTSCEDEVFWAACELYTAVSMSGGSSSEAEKYKKAIYERVDEVDVCKFTWRETAGFGTLCCLFKENDLDNKFIEKLQNRIKKEADRIVDVSNQSGYGTAIKDEEYVWGSILPIMNNAMVLIFAKMLTNSQNYQDIAGEQLDYLLGKNATGYSFVTGFGENAFRYPHNRASYADGVSDPIPGLVSGGPNKRYVDAVCKMLIPLETPPAKFYIDDTWTASANENAIYWNSVAIFVTAYFDSLC